VTLAELLVVIVILGIIAGVGVHALHAPAREEAEGRMARSLIAARAEAIKARRPVVVRIEDSSGTSVATALPDGSITTEPTLRARIHLNSLTGATLIGGDTGRARD
jgi:Tfp pilus assembly protein FimT